jgi:hypothetical protein
MSINSKALHIVTWLFLFTLVASGQVCREFPCTVSSKATGEEASAAIDNFLSEAIQNTERIFVFAIPGNRENRNATNPDRLCEARRYILGRLGRSGFQQQYPPVFGEGPAARGEGRIEFYLGSTLYLTRFISLNSPANLDCCGELSRRERRQVYSECRDWLEKGEPNVSPGAAK